MAPFPLSGSPELATRINEKDWSTTPLGPSDHWPQSLCTALDIALGSRFPMQLLWGPAYIHLYNDAYIPIAADKHPAALGRPGAEIWPEVWEALRPTLDRVRATGEPSWSDDRLLVLERRGMLEEGYYTFSYGPVRGEEGAIDGIFIAVTETTRRVIEERRLRTVRDLSASRGRADDEATLLAAACESLAANPHDIPFALLYLTDSARRGLRLACSVGMPEAHPAAPAFVTLGEPHGGLPWPFAAVLDAGEAAVVAEDQLATTAPLPGGPWGAPAGAAVALPLRSDAGTILGCLIAGVSPRLRLDGEYREFLARVSGEIAMALASARALARASEDVRIRDDFLSIAAHELKTPLTPLIGKLQLIQRRLAREGVAERNLGDLESAAREAARLVGMIDALLDLSRLRSGQLHIVPTALDLRAIAGEAVAEVEPTLQRHRLRLVAPAEPVVIAGDGLRLTQAARNLISNAVKYSPQGGTVTVEVASLGADVTLSVTDEGIGIAPELLPKIFERYYRAGGDAAASIGGLGLGLFVVHEVVRLHGGSVSVESTPEVGSRFTITLPVVAADSGEERTSGTTLA